jgi:hypothetical protein
MGRGDARALAMRPSASPFAGASTCPGDGGCGEVSRDGDDGDDGGSDDGDDDDDHEHDDVDVDDDLAVASGIPSEDELDVDAEGDVDADPLPCSPSGSGSSTSSMPSYSPITTPSHMRLACVKRRRSALPCTQAAPRPRSATVPATGRSATLPRQVLTAAPAVSLPPQAAVASSALAESPVGGASSSVSGLQAPPPAAAASSVSSSRKELAIIWYLLQHLCWKYALGQRVLVQSQKILIDQYRQQKRARNLALAACCCVIYACEHDNVAAPDLQEGLDFCASLGNKPSLAEQQQQQLQHEQEQEQEQLQLLHEQSPASAAVMAAAAAAVAAAAAGGREGGAPGVPLPQLSPEEQEQLRQRVNLRRSIIQASVERANDSLLRSRAAAAARAAGHHKMLTMGMGNGGSETDSGSEEDLCVGVSGAGGSNGAGVGGGESPAASPTARRDDREVFGSSPDSTISVATGGITCSPVDAAALSHHHFLVQRRGGGKGSSSGSSGSSGIDFEDQARGKRPCLMRRGKSASRRVGFCLERNEEAEFDAFQSVQGFALNLAALAVAVAATGDSSSASSSCSAQQAEAPQALVVPLSSCASDAATLFGHGGGEAAWGRRARSGAVSD